MRRLVPILPLVLLAALPACGVGGLLDDLSGAKFDTPVGESMTNGEYDFALQVFDLVNAEREHAGQPALLWDEVAADAGYDHCVDMRVRGFYAHVNPDGDGPCARLLDAGVSPYSCGGENLARTNDSPHDVMAAWMASPDHRALILAPGVSHVGVGVHTGSGGPWWALEFTVHYE